MEECATFTHSRALSLTEYLPRVTRRLEHENKGPCPSGAYNLLREGKEGTKSIRNSDVRAPGKTEGHQGWEGGGRGCSSLEKGQSGPCCRDEVWGKT